MQGLGRPDIANAGSRGSRKSMPKEGQGNQNKKKPMDSISEMLPSCTDGEINN
ncbi:unnamed protein product [Staurois parvus]|uniref:Uncharacterized protein n=1 Tax=Staurois parvus TaxID=386267 RepID=A0ABN9CDL6_9NEOB|nr:unnamed protein product [Staurois parvus]